MSHRHRRIPGIIDEAEFANLEQKSGPELAALLGDVGALIHVHGAMAQRFRLRQDAIRTVLRGRERPRFEASDHAVVRWLEKARCTDIAAVRAQIVEAAAAAAAGDGNVCRAKGDAVAYELDGLGFVVTHSKIIATVYRVGEDERPASKPIPRAEIEGRRPVHVFDVDGTLADNAHRIHHIQKQPKDWDAFFDACAGDRPIEHVCEIARMCAEAGKTIVVVTGRPFRTREATAGWLARNGIKWLAMYMRDDGDHRPDDEIKGELLAKMRADGLEPAIVFDDRNRVVKAWRAAGIPCAQVAEGDF